MIIVSQDGRAFVDLELTMCVKIVPRHKTAYDIYAICGAATHLLGTYNSEDDADVILGTILVNKFKPDRKMFIMPNRNSKYTIDGYRVILESEGEKDD